MSADLRNDMSILSQQLLLTVAEELKTPLLQIARLAELSQYNQPADIKKIQSTADIALRLIDSYSLGVRMALSQGQLERESVSVSSVLYDSSQQLDSFAKNYGIDLRLEIAGKYGPVLANRQGLQAALVSIGAALIEALPAQGNQQLKLYLATHRSRYGIVAGLYANTKQISKSALESGRLLQKTSRQPLINLTHTSGAGIFVADSILKAMDLHLISSRHHRLYGLGTVLQPNHQMQLV